MVGILLLQDFDAIFMPAFFDSNNIDQGNALRLLLAFPVLIIFAYLTTRFILIKLIARFDHFKEYIFLLTIGWCHGLAALAAEIGLSAEIGAFVAGMSLKPIAFRYLLRRFSEINRLAWDAGLRLGQISEFLC